MPVFTVEGNIGGGKSTLLQRLKDATGFSEDHVVLFEPVDEWMTFKAPSSDKGLFELYYADKAKYGFIFQMLALQTRAEDLVRTIKENPSKIIICERCFLTDNELFAKMLYVDGFMTETEFMVYTKWYNFVQDTLQIDMRGIIYLRVEPEVCVSRISKRDRSGEEAISMSYIKQLHVRHEEWLVSRPCSDDVLVISNNDEEAIRDIVNFVNKMV